MRLPRLSKSAWSKSRSATLRHSDTLARRSYTRHAATHQLVVQSTILVSYGLAADDFLDFASANAEDDISPLGAASSELGKIFDVLLDRKITPNLAHQDTVILSQHALQIFALSPLQARVIQFLKVIAGLIPTLKQPRRRVADLHPNLVSLVLRFVVGSNCIVLGADLQETPFNGWTDLLNNSQCIEGPRASLFKVPHHGSHNAHLDRQWTDLLIANPHVALTPYNRGSRKLPHATDVARILKLSNNSFSTARATSTAPNRFDTAVVRSLKEGNIVMHSSDTKLGHVQFRKLINDPTKPWRTTLFGNAVRLHNIGV